MAKWTRTVCAPTFLFVPEGRKEEGVSVMGLLVLMCALGLKVMRFLGIPVPLCLKRRQSPGEKVPIARKTKGEYVEALSEITAINAESLRTMIIEKLKLIYSSSSQAIGDAARRRTCARFTRRQ